jgi:hypothetical protein
MITESWDDYYALGRTGGDFERGYAKGYDRALSQLVELVECRVPPTGMCLEIVRDMADKLRREALES